MCLKCQISTIHHHSKCCPFPIVALQCTNYMNSNPAIPWRSIGWTATTVSGLTCGDRLCIRNRRNNLQTTVYVVDHGGNGFDLDYTRVFKVLDPDSVDYARGNMDIEYAKC